MKLKWKMTIIIGYRCRRKDCGNIMSNNEEYEIGKSYYDSVNNQILYLSGFELCSQQNDVNTTGCHECRGYPEFILSNGRHVISPSRCKKLLSKQGSLTPYLRLQYRHVQNTNDRW